jgi:hypothetical protein
MHRIAHKDDVGPHKHGHNEFAGLPSTDTVVKRRVGDALAYYEFSTADAQAARAAEAPRAAEAACAAETARAAEVARAAEAARAAEVARAAEAARAEEVARKAKSIDALLNGKNKEAVRAVGRMIQQKCKKGIMNT